MWPNPKFAADLVTYIEEILNGNIHFLCSLSVNFNGRINDLLQILIILIDELQHPCALSTFRVFIFWSISSSCISWEVNRLSVLYLKLGNLLAFSAGVQVIVEKISFFLEVRYKFVIYKNRWYNGKPCRV